MLDKLIQDLIYSLDTGNQIQMVLLATIKTNHTQNTKTAYTLYNRRDIVDTKEREDSGDNYNQGDKEDIREGNHWKGSKLERHRINTFSQLIQSVQFLEDYADFFCN